MQDQSNIRWANQGRGFDAETMSPRMAKLARVDLEEIWHLAGELVTTMEYGGSMYDTNMHDIKHAIRRKLITVSDEFRLVEINEANRRSGLPEWKDMEDFKKKNTIHDFKKLQNGVNNMRSHYTRNNGDHVFNPNTEGVTDESHILLVAYCPLCQEEEAELDRQSELSYDPAWYGWEM